jgi:hypothetical protein
VPRYIRSGRDQLALVARFDLFAALVADQLSLGFAASFLVQITVV